MRARLCAAVVVASLLPAEPPTALSREEVLLARVLTIMKDNLQRLPNYTCLQTIERSRRSTRGQRYQFIDRVRMEVALVGGKELFSWPGAGNFEDKELDEMVIGGAIGNGNFGLHAKSVFGSGSATFQFAGERIYEGRPTYRWDFRVPVFRSGYTLRAGDREAIVGYHGSFWADAESLDVVRLEVHADDIPPHLEMAAAEDAVNYERVRIGGHAFLLPRSSELILTDFGGESRNWTEFTGCRQYTGESVIRFDDAAADTQVVREAPREVQLPDGLLVTLSLSKSLVAAEAAVGDPVEAVVRSDVKRDKKVYVPKGALARGRVVWLRNAASGLPWRAIGLEFQELTWGTAKAAFHARLHEVQARSDVGLSPPSNSSLFGARTQVRLDSTLARIPGLLFGRLGETALPRGLLMTWRTEAEAQAEDQGDPVPAPN